MIIFCSSRPGEDLWSSATVKFGIPYSSLSAALSVFITILITTHLLLFRRQLRRELGSSHALAIPYVSIAGMLIESSALYAACFLLFIGPYASGSHISNLFLPTLVQVQVRY